MTVQRCTVHFFPSLLPPIDTRANIQVLMIREPTAEKCRKNRTKHFCSGDWTLVAREDMTPTHQRVGSLEKMTTATNLRDEQDQKEIRTRPTPPVPSHKTNALLKRHARKTTPGKCCRGPSRKSGEHRPQVTCRRKRIDPKAPQHRFRLNRFELVSRQHLSTLRASAPLVRNVIEIVTVVRRRDR